MEFTWNCLLGGVAAVFATFFTNPIEVLKTRIQLQGELKSRGEHAVHFRNIFHAGYVVAKNEGFIKLQNGLVPALWTQLFLNGLRLGVYQCADLNGFIRDPDGNLIFHRSIIWGAIGGGVGAAASSPFFLIKTQLQSKAAASSISVGTQHDHSGTFNTLKKIYSKGGILGLWRGVETAIPRAAVGSTAQLTSFSFCKQWMNERHILHNSPILLTFVASMVGGVAISVAITPFDLIATRIYNQGIDAKGKGLIYDGVIDCCIKIWKTEGFLGFYKGLGPNYLRLGPHTVLVLIFWEQLKKLHDTFNQSNPKVK